MARKVLIGLGILLILKKELPSPVLIRPMPFPKMKRKAPNRKSTDQMQEINRTDDLWSDPLVSLFKPEEPLSSISGRTELKGSHSGCVQEVSVYKDGSEQYWYPDNIQIISRPRTGLKVVGRYLDAKEWRDKLRVAFEDEWGEMMRFDIPESRKEYNEAFTKISVEEDLVRCNLKRMFVPTLRTEEEERLKRLRLEMNSLVMRHRICNLMLTQFVARRSLADFFTLHTIKRGKGGKKPSPPLKEITLQKAKELIAKKHKRISYKKGPPYTLCRSSAKIPYQG